MVLVAHCSVSAADLPAGRAVAVLLVAFDVAALSCEADQRDCLVFDDIKAGTGTELIGLF